MTNRRMIAAALQALLPLIAGSILFALGWEAVPVRPIYTNEGSPAQVENYYKNILPAKPVNTWGAKDMAKAGFPGCVPTGDVAEDGPYPTMHMVRLPISEGWKWVLITPAELARRTEGFGGTPSTKDDVKLVGDCY